MSVAKRVFFCFYGVLVASSVVFGQAAKSPFSTFGIGENYGTSLAHNQGMGGVGLSQPQVWFLNNQNPALLAYNTFTVFQAGILAEQLDISDGTTRESVRGGNLNYLALGFPIKFGKIATSIGLSPYTNVNYKLQYIEQVGNSTDTATITEEGRGGLTQLYWSNGFKIHKNIAVGVKASYVFGSVDNVFQNEVTNFTRQVLFITGVDENTYSKGFLVGGGISYSVDSLFKGNYRFSVGAVYDFEGKLTAERDVDLYRLSGITGDTIESSTLRREKGTLQLPSSVGVGISFGKDRKWAIGIDYSQQDWTTFRSLSNDDENLGRAWRLGIGGEYTPDFVSLNYFKRVTYRIGVSQAPFFANGRKVNDFGINFGFSLPTGRSSIDLAFKAGRRGSLTDNALTENYFKVYVGLTLNDQWFIKRKFD
jgi:hypothetical protein